ncbi:MAG: PKD domain-containing protein [Thermodesulfobacteriota bacterium]
MNHHHGLHNWLRTFGIFGIIILGLLCIVGTGGDEIEETEETPASQTANNTLPTAAITAPANNATFTEGDLITFSGSGVDTEDGTLTGASLVWSSSRDGRMGIGTNIPNASLSTGTHVITLTVTDSQGGTGSATATITVNVQGNTIPVAAITSPASGSTFGQGQFITFSGTGTDTEDGLLQGNALIWSSQIDGQIGMGGSIIVNNLSSGSHTIRLAATDSAGTTGTDSVTITIGNTPPTAVINYPVDGATIHESESVTFSGTGSDPEDGVLSGNSLVWRSNKDGQIGIGISPTVSYLSSGAHTITLLVTDSDGATGTDTVALTVGNTAPTAAIQNPADGDTFSSGDLVIFNGTGTDEEDGNLYGGNLVWTSNRDNLIGTGTNFSVSSLSAGMHLITLTVTDGNGAVDSESITITIQ